MARKPRLQAWLAWTAALGVAAALLPLFLAWRHLPDPVAIHFGPSGAPDGNLSRVGWVALTVAQPLLALFFAWPRQPVAAVQAAARGAPVRLAVVGGFAAMSGALTLVTIWHNWERASWREAGPFEGLWLLPLLGIPLLSALVLGALASRWWPVPNALASGAVEAARPLARGERAYWSGQASNSWFFLIAIGILVEGALFQLMLSRTIGGHVLMFVHLLLLVVLEQFSKIRVSVDERVLTIRYGRLGWIRQRLPLDRVTSASAFELDPWEHGGWGYRGSLRIGGAAAVVVRSGSALQLALRDGARFTISVDDAQTAAGWINAFVQHRAHPPVQGSAAPVAPEAER